MDEWIIPQGSNGLIAELMGEIVTPAGKYNGEETHFHTSVYLALDAQDEIATHSSERERVRTRT